MHRRAVLAALGSTVLAGCSDLVPEFEGPPESETPAGGNGGRTDTPIGTPASGAGSPTPADGASAQSGGQGESTPTDRPDDRGTSTPTPSVAMREIGLLARNAGPSDPITTLQARYNGRLQGAIDLAPNSPGRRFPPDGATFLVVRFRLRNTGGRPLALTPDLFEASVGGVRYDPVDAEDPFDDLEGFTLESGASTDGWVPFWVPEDAERATLVVDQSAYEGAVAVSFERDFTIDPAIPTGG